MGPSREPSSSSAASVGLLCFFVDRVVVAVATVVVRSISVSTHHRLPRIVGPEITYWCTEIGVGAIRAVLVRTVSA